LQNNDGPVPTRALLAGSPAIAAGGSVLGITTDARGKARPGNSPSVGAYQYVLASSTETPTTSTAAGDKLAETGKIIPLVAVAGLLLGSLSYIYFDFLRHRKPLKEQDPGVRYSFAHHLKVVTIPLLKYRVSIGVSKVGKNNSDNVRRF